MQNEKQDGDDDAGGLRVGSMFASRAVEIRKNVTVAPTGELLTLDKAVMIHDR